MDLREDESFSLQEDLNRLRAVTSIGALEATVFYAGRILEGIVRKALATLSIDPSRYLLNNLLLLEQLNLLPRVTCYWAHALRRLGNDVRHLQRPVGSADSTLALVLIERLLAWYLQAFPDSHRSLQRDESLLDLGGPPQLREVVEALEKPNADPLQFSRELFDGRRNCLLSAPVLPAVLVQILVECGYTQEAEAVLEAALKKFSDDTRLRQLMGLCLSRSGKLREALQWIEPLSEQSLDDPETAGIHAGVHKRMWQEGHDLCHLAKAQRIYFESWLRSRSSNAYVGVNAAAALLWLGRETESRFLAAECVVLLERRIHLLQRISEDRNLRTWDSLAFAEALFLAGNLEKSRSTYQCSIASVSKETSDVKVALEQLCIDLQALGLDADAEDFLSLKDPPSGLDELVIGITGHRDVESSSRLIQKVRTAVDEIRAARCCQRGVCVVALSPLAEGADRIGARSILEMDVPSRLRVVLPFALCEYKKDFKHAESLREFHDLLIRAESIHFLGESGNTTLPEGPLCSEERTELYAACGRFVVDHSDFLLAVWDGQPSRGLGSTAEVIEYATKRGCDCRILAP